MNAPKDERRLTDGDFWDMAALDALQGLMTTAGDVPVSRALEEIPKNCAMLADRLVEERRKRREGGAT